MPDTLRIKRRAAGGAAGPPSTLAAAELAFNEQDNVLYYGKGNSGGNATSIIPIGGDKPAIASVSDTAPSSPAIGQLWWDSNHGGLFIYFDSTWVQIGGAEVN
jgi:hypothetical protein